MLTDEIFKVQLPLLEYAAGPGGGMEKKMLIENRTKSIRILAPMNTDLLLSFHPGEDHIYIRGQYDDQTKQIEARQQIRGLEW